MACSASLSLRLRGSYHLTSPAVSYTPLQVEQESGYDASVSWTNTDDATSILLTASNGVRTLTETLPASINNYNINDVTYGDSWNVILRAVNDKGYSLPVSSNLKIGKTAMAFLSTYASPEELVANGDDDEASAWLWMHNQYPCLLYTSMP